MNLPKELTPFVGVAATLTVPVPRPPPAGTNALICSTLIATTLLKVKLTVSCY